MKLVDGPISAKLLHKKGKNIKHLKKEQKGHDLFSENNYRFGSLKQNTSQYNSETLIPIDCFIIRCDQDEPIECINFVSLKSTISVANSNSYSRTRPKDEIVFGKHNIQQKTTINLNDYESDIYRDDLMKKQKPFCQRNQHEAKQENEHIQEGDSMHQNSIFLFVICRRSQVDDSILLRDPVRDSSIVSQSYSTLDCLDIIGTYKIIHPEHFNSETTDGGESFELFSDAKSIHWKRVEQLKIDLKTTTMKKSKSACVLTSVTCINIPSRDYDEKEKNEVESCNNQESFGRIIPLLITFDVHEYKDLLIKSISNTRSPESYHKLHEIEPCKKSSDETVNSKIAHWNKKRKMQKHTIWDDVFDGCLKTSKTVIELIVKVKYRVSSKSGLKECKVICSNLESYHHSKNISMMDSAECAVAKRDQFIKSCGVRRKNKLSNKNSGILLVAKRVFSSSGMAYQIQKHIVNRKETEGGEKLCKAITKKDYNHVGPIETYSNQKCSGSSWGREKTDASTLNHYGATSHQIQDEDQRNAGFVIDSKVGDFYFVKPCERSLITDYMFFLMAQVRLGQLTEKDLGKKNRKKNDCLGIGYRGMRCRHCGGFDRGNYFPSSCKNLQACSTMIHTHIMKCHLCPDEIKISLKKTKAKHREQMTNMIPGTQVLFFSRLWERIHDIHYDGKDQKLINTVNGIINLIVEENLIKKTIRQDPEVKEKLNMSKKERYFPYEDMPTTSFEYDVVQNNELTQSDQATQNIIDIEGNYVHSIKSEATQSSLIPHVASSEIINEDTEISIDSDFDLVKEVLEETSQDAFNSNDETDIDPDIDLTPNAVTVPHTYAANYQEQKRPIMIEEDSHEVIIDNTKGKDSGLLPNVTHARSEIQDRFSIQTYQFHSANQEEVGGNPTSPCDSLVESKEDFFHPDLPNYNQLRKPKKQKSKVIKMRKSCSKIFNNEDDVLLIRGILKHGRKWRQIWDDSEGLHHIKASSLKDRARSRRFQNLLERVRLDESILDDPGALYDFTINGNTEDHEFFDQSLSTPVKDDSDWFGINITSSTALDNLFTEYEFSSPPYHPIATLKFAPNSLERIAFPSESYNI